MTVLRAFPQRPLVLKPGRGAIGAWMVSAIGILVFGGFLALAAIEIGPAIRDDFTVRDSAQVAQGARISEGRCRSRLFLFQSCDVTIAWRDKDGAHTRKLSYMFVEPHMGSWTAVPMTDPARPGLVTTDLGLDRLWNRVGTVIGGVLFALAVMVGLVVAAWKARGLGAAVKQLSGRTLEAVPVVFRGWGNGPSWIVADERGQAFEWPVRKSDKPFVLDDARGLVLALRDPAGGPAFPLDEKLRFVVLTPGERGAIEAARRAG
jgi:hypothetical protein